MAHLGARAFEDIGGEVVQTTAFVFDNANIKNYQSNFKRLVAYSSQDAKEEEYLKDDNLYTSSAANFSKIPGSPIAYWCKANIIRVFENCELLGDLIPTKKGMDTGNNDYFIKLWYEINFDKFDCIYHSKKWVPYDKGGNYRKWYGNNDYVVNWENDGYELKNSKANLRSQNLYFKKSITWNALSSADTCFRASMYNGTFDSAGSSMFPETNFEYCLGLMNSVQTQYFLKIINPTLNYGAGSIAKTPIIFSENEDIKNIVIQNINSSKLDWDSFETSWDFKIHPLVKNHVSTISEAYNLWYKECEDRFNTLKSNEEELNRIFIDIYGLQDELDPYVEDKDVTVRKADFVRDIKSFISYAVGCMFGRYSLDVEGLAYAGGEWDSSKYSTFTPDTDDIIPICDEEYFEDDIVTRFVEFVRVVYGTDTLEDNLSFIANALGGKGAPRDVLRNYFLNDFFKDHCNTYQVTGSGKRPIYWLFDSGKKNGFKALVYIHRYTPDLIARMRTGYVHPQQARYRTQIELLQNQIDEASSTSEKVKLSKQLKKINEQLQELNKYEEVVHHWADKMEPMDLDDGVKANYAKFQELLAKIK